jgi:hypothetical protein
MHTNICLLSNTQFGSWQEAQDECCAYGAWAASFSSLEEMQCFTMSNKGMRFDHKINIRLANNFLFCLALKIVANGHMWTSGTNQGVFSEANFGWCSNGYLVPDDNMWVSYEGPYDPWAKRCVTIRLVKDSPMDSKLENAPCGAKLNGVLCRIPDN